MSYELRALLSRHDVTDRAARAAGCHVVRLPQGYGLVPVTSDVFDRLGGGEVRPFGDAFWFPAGRISSHASPARLPAVRLAASVPARVCYFMRVTVRLGGG